MNQLSRHKPIRRVSRKRAHGRDPAYLSEIHRLPCIICDAYGEPQNSPTQAHHTTNGRFSNLRTPDRQAIPLCEGHHQGLLDTSKVAYHRDRAEWERRYGKDTDWISVTQDAIEGSLI